MHCGIDFGTSNTAVGTQAGESPILLPLEGDDPTIPSAVFYHDDSPEIGFGRDAIATYLSGDDGRLMRSIKSVLGTSLMDESTLVGARQITFDTVITDFLREMKRRAECALGTELTAVVQGRPVHFTTAGDEADQVAEDTLERILRTIGFTEVRFLYEPVAAALHFEELAGAEHLALVADIGGGTSDFSVVRINPNRSRGAQRADAVLGNSGIRLGGTDFDQALGFAHVMPLLGRGTRMPANGLIAPNWIYTTLSSWPRINMLQAPKALRDIAWVVENGVGDPRFGRLAQVIEKRLGHRIAVDVEQAKIALSNDREARLVLDYVEAGLRPTVSEADVNKVLADARRLLTQTMEDCLRISGLKTTSITLVVLTGGSTEMPLVQRTIRDCLPDAILTSTDTFGAVGKGLALEASRAFS